MTGYEIRLGTAAQTHAVRHAVLRNGKPDETVVKKGDPTAFHLLAVAGGETIGVVSCVDEPDGWQLYQMAVADEWQGAGVGRALVLRLLDIVCDKGGAVVWANARDAAIPFYEKLGFRVEGDGFPGWVGIPHHKVIRDLN